MNSAIDYQTLIRLDVFKQNAFAYLAAKRALPTSMKFCEKYSFGDPAVFEETINILYNSIFDLNLTDIAENQLELIEGNSPATDDFPTHDGTVAQDCGGVFFTALEMLISKNRNENLDDISTLLTNAFDAYVVSKHNLDYSDLNFEKIINSDPDMIGEIDAQNGIISFLKSKKEINQNDIEYLINWQKSMIVNLIAN